jgi:hypothetical protein
MAQYCLSNTLSQPNKTLGYPSPHPQQATLSSECVGPPAASVFPHAVPHSHRRAAGLQLFPGRGSSRPGRAGAGAAAACACCLPVCRMHSASRQHGSAAGRTV